METATEELIRQSMLEEGISFKQAVNNAIIRGLSRPRPESHTPTFRMGVPRENLDKALQLAAGLEDVALLQKMELNK